MRLANYNTFFGELPGGSLSTTVGAVIVDVGVSLIGRVLEIEFISSVKLKSPCLAAIERDDTYVRTMQYLLHVVHRTLQPNS